MRINYRRNMILLAGHAGLVLVLVGCGQPSSAGGGSGSSAQTGTFSPVPLDHAPEAMSDLQNASWEVREPNKLSSTSTVIHISVTRGTCANGVTGKVLEPQIHIEGDKITIQAVVEELEGRSHTCPSNDFVALTVELPGPIGKRSLVDAYCLDSSTQGNAYCAADAGVRWKP